MPWIWKEGDHVCDSCINMGTHCDYCIQSGPELLTDFYEEAVDYEPFSDDRACGGGISDGCYPYDSEQV